MWQKKAPPCLSLGWEFYDQRHVKAHFKNPKGGPHHLFFFGGRRVGNPYQQTSVPFFVKVVHNLVSKSNSRTAEEFFSTRVRYQFTLTPPNRLP